MEQTIIEKIKSYLYSRDEVVTAYIFGSYTTEKVSSMSDIDI
ncbi:MAG: nucleotidyltransferase domain-containing protein [Nitrospirae bacterium]|nr:nucleotidyltransferase domain-containing protein [Nitrospirota bacterium]